MVQRRHFIVFVLVALFFVENAIFSISNKKEDLNISNFVYLSNKLTKALVLEFPSIVSDYLFLNTLTFMGEKVLQEKDLSSDEWKKIYAALDLITFLDPWSTDPYILAETTLPWDAGMVVETNKLLYRMAEHRPNDYRPFFYLWFNHFYFLHDPSSAGKYLEKAAKIPGSPSYFPTLTARMKVYSGQYQVGIQFLEEMLLGTYDNSRRQLIEMRLDALKKLAYLEHAVKIFREKFSKAPVNLLDLVSAGIINTIPEDPYGGTFFIMENGRVYTTSKLALAQKNKEVPQ